MRFPTMNDHAGIFETHRPRLEGFAYRMIGSRADACDLVQETWLRWRRVDPGIIADPGAWLLTTCARLALNQLGSARSRRETYVGPWLPDPWPDEGAADPAARAEIDDSVSIALLVALERLSAAERAAFILHETFGYSFDEIAILLERRPEACRQLASRARSALRSGRSRFPTTAAAHSRLVTAFMDAARAGEVERLRALLAEEVELHPDGGGKTVTLPEVLHGADAVAGFLVGVWRSLSNRKTRASIRLRRFNGAPGALVFADDELVAALQVVIAGGRIQRIYAHRNPDKLRWLASP